MTKSNQSKKPLAATSQRSKKSPRIASKKLPTTADAKKMVSARSSKGDLQSTGKTATIATLLRRPKGASIDDLMKATGWQAHSVRGAISGTIRKKQGLNVTSEKSGDVRLYRIADKAVG